MEKITIALRQGYPSSEICLRSALKKKMQCYGSYLSCYFFTSTSESKYIEDCSLMLGNAGKITYPPPKRLNRLPRESPSPEVFKIRVDTALSNIV